MLPKVIDDLRSQVSDGLYAIVFTPAAFFWLAGLAAWCAADPDRAPILLGALEKLSDVKILLALGAALALIVLSAAAYEPVNDWFLQRLLGYWWPFGFLGVPFRAFQAWVVRRAFRRQGTTSDPEANDAIERTLHYLPDPDHAMPTAFGGALVAADRRITAKYGLASEVVWTPLSFVLPDAARSSVAARKTDIDASARLIFWTLASLVWLSQAHGWLESAIIVLAVAGVAAFAYARLVTAGRAYADAYEAAFDVGRVALYKALRLKLPPNNDQEPAYGAAVTNLLFRGLPTTGVWFTDPSS